MSRRADDLDEQPENANLDSTRPLVDHKKNPEIMECYLQAGNAVEVVEQDKLCIIPGVVQEVRIGDDMIYFQPNSEVAGNSMLVERTRVRPELGIMSYKLTELPATAEFKVYETVDVWIGGKWLVGVIVHVPTGSEPYSVRILRDDITVSFRSKMRRHLEWDSINSWTEGICKLERQSLKTPHQLEVTLVGGHKAKILRYVGDEHVLVEYMDLTHANGTRATEIIKRKKWHMSTSRKRWEQLMAWINPGDPPLEFVCYMPAYICLGILGLVSPILFTDLAQHWPENSVALFYTFGGISFFLCIIILIGLMCRQPRTRAELNRWRAIYLVAVLTGVVFVVLLAVYGRLDLLKAGSRKHKVLMSCPDLSRCCGSWCDVYGYSGSDAQKLLYASKK